MPEAPDALALLTAAGVPSFRTPEACADAIAAALKRRAPRPIAVRARRSVRQAGMLDELEAYALLDRLGVPRAPSVALDADVSSARAALSLSGRGQGAVRRIAHKTEIGGVVLNVTDDAALLAAIRTSAQAQDTSVDRVLVQPMISGLGEVLIGYRVDPDVGPLVMVAAGGVLAEIYRDRSLRLAPVDLAEAQEMIGEVAALKALAGYRGKPRGDLDALAQAHRGAVAARGADGPAVAEAEINPLIVRAEGPGRRRGRRAGETRLRGEQHD